MAFSDPTKIIEDVGIQEGSTVADLGAGTGFYSMAAAKAVGPNGRVYAVDVQQDLLARIKNTAHVGRVHNIEVIHGDIERLNGTRLREQSVDLVIVANVMFQLENKVGLLDEAKRILKPNGRILLVDWSDSFGGMGPQASMVFTQQDAKTLFESKGFAFVTGVVAGDHHYGLIFRKS
ncbi:MAG: type 11 methyltransferase [Candidatus Paceibacter sp.]|jgi:ubiquinone/menaquinone biosynthesis C-methylase UbiE|nr:type 11 methyltransferase [Candidatus Paceibacter sp.]